MTTEAMDWEAAMKAARRSAEKAATLGERTVGGVAEMLHRQGRHSSDLAAATQALAQIDARLSSLIEESRAARSALLQLSRTPAPAPPPLAVLGPLRGAGGARRVRRVFVELVMLRDTLRTRLALVGRTAMALAGLVEENGEPIAGQHEQRQGGKAIRGYKDFISL